MIDSSIEEKQQFLRNQILEKGYDQIFFTEFLINKKGPEAEDISFWSMEELKKIVKEFIILNGGVIEENEEIKKPLQSEIIEVVFMFKGLTTIIQCNLNDIMKDIINKFMTKADINNHNLIFLYGGELINKNISLKNLIKDLDYKNNKVNIIVDEMEDDDLKNKKK